MSITKDRVKSPINNYMGPCKTPKTGFLSVKTLSDIIKNQ